MWGETPWPDLAAFEQETLVAWAALQQHLGAQTLRLGEHMALERDDPRLAVAAAAGALGKPRRPPAASDASTLASPASEDEEALSASSGPEAARRPSSPESLVAALHQAAKGVERAPGVADALLRQLRRALPHITSARLLSRLAWALGKLGLSSPDVDAAVAHICSVAPKALAKFTSQDLTNTLWGIARLREGVSRASAAGVARLSQAIVRACAQRVQELTAQCLANSLWAVARLRLRRELVRDFLGGCLRELGGSRDLRGFTTQGIANILWALAELCAGGGAADAARKESQADRGTSAGARLVFSLMSVEAHGRVADFQPQELSMVAWACAKFYGRGGRSTRRRGSGGRGGGRPEEVDALLLGIAFQAAGRLEELSPQSVSNIAWALATCELLAQGCANAPARAFMCDAMVVAAGRLEDYSPQAVANLMWAIVRLTSRGAAPATARLQLAVAAFSAVAARHATLHLMEFSWRDLAGIAVALAHTRAQSAEAMTFMTLLVGHSAAHCPDLTPQLLLNVAQSAARLKLDRGSMQAMVDAIAERIASGQLQLNDVDQRQWQEVIRWCPPQQFWA